MPDYNISVLNISSENLFELQDVIYKYHNLQILWCNHNNIKILDNLPFNLLKLYCSNNKLTNLDNLPANLQILDCGNNNITHIL